LGSSQGQPESGYDLVEDEKNIMLFGDPPHSFQVALLREHRADVAQNRLHDQGGDLVGIGGQDGLQGSRIIVGHLQSVFGRVLRHPSGVGGAKGGGS